MKKMWKIFSLVMNILLIKNENGRRILKSWGLNNNGQLGIGSFATNNEQNANIYVPTKVIFPGSFNISIKSNWRKFNFFMLNRR